VSVARDIDGNTIGFTLNGVPTTVEAEPVARATQVLRDIAGKTGTKVGCDAGDCGACTILLDGAAVCACMVPAGRLEGRRVETVEGLADNGTMNNLQQAFLHYGAAQCGICTPGMLVSATALLRANPTPSAQQVEDALGGVLCRCTGYRKIIDAVMAAHAFDEAVVPVAAGQAVGSRLRRVDGEPKVLGSDVFGADFAPDGALVVRTVRSPHHRASFEIGDTDAFSATHPGIVRVFTADDIPGVNSFGVIPGFAEQPAFAEGQTRFRGEVVAAIAGEADAMAVLDLEDFPVVWTALSEIMSVGDAIAPGAPQLFEDRPANLLISGFVRCGDLDQAFEAADQIVEDDFETSYVEHAYIEPEAGYAIRVGDRIEVHACTQAAYMDRDDVAGLLGLAVEDVRIVVTATGGAFGSKLDISLQPYIALAAWVLGRPARMTYSRPESMKSTTKRHPASMHIKIGATNDGKVSAIDFDGLFNTGAYASWGPTVANRVPVHASGPYVVPNYRAEAKAIHTNGPPSGAFRGFGVPQASFAQEVMFDELADAIGMDRLEFRINNALVNGATTVCGQVLAAGVGIKECLEVLRPHWSRALSDAAAFNDGNPGVLRHGVGVAGMWYGCGNTSLSNPSTIKVGIRSDGSLKLFQGAADIGQGANTVMAQICADAVGLPVDQFDILYSDTDVTPDAGKTSASRQTFVSGKASYLAGQDLRSAILKHTNASDEATITLSGTTLTVRDNDAEAAIDLGNLEADAEDFVLMGEGTFDPPTQPLDENGQGIPYASYGFGAHLAEIEVDTALGTVTVLKITASHDVGRAINPTMVEGQIEGGVAQGLGMALMEEFIPGRSENLHDYLIPTIGDVPEIENILVEEADALGPYGAKGIGEQALIPTAPAIINALKHACGARLRRLPATPDRVRQAILQTRDHKS